MGLASERRTLTVTGCGEWLDGEAMMAVTMRYAVENMEKVGRALAVSALGGDGTGYTMGMRFKER
jgi:hypothetical protein